MACLSYLVKYLKFNKLKYILFITFSIKILFIILIFYEDKQLAMIIYCKIFLTLTEHTAIPLPCE